ncbi:MAG: two-component regulator propeller domain-containing protein [Bacteroidota bacterium]
MRKAFTFSSHLKSLLFAFSLSLSGVLYGQSLHFEDYDIASELKPYQVNTIYQDVDNFLWIGTNKGVIKFDGIDYHILSEKDSLSGKSVTAITQDSLKTIWLGFENGTLSSYNGNDIVQFKPDEGSAVEPVSEILFDDRGIMWYSTRGDGLYYYVNERLYRVDEEEGMPDIYIYDILIKDGKIWAASDGGVAICKLDSPMIHIEVIDYEDGLPDNIVRSLDIPPFNNDIIILGTEDAGLVGLDPSTLEVIYPFLMDEWDYGTITDISSGENQLWVGTKRNGLISYDPETKAVENFGVNDGLGNRSVLDLFIDGSENLWVSSRTGIQRTIGNEIEFLSLEGQVSGQDILSLDIDTEGNIWYVTENGLFQTVRDQKNDGIVQRLSELEYIPFISVLADENGNVWVGTYGSGLYRIESDNPSSYTLYTEEIVNGNILNISEYNGEIWLSTLGGATSLILDDNGKPVFKNYNRENGLTSDYIYDIFVDSKDRVWFATDGNGCFVLENGKFKNYSEENGLNAKAVYSISEDSNGFIWLNALKEGVYKFKDNEFEKAKFANERIQTSISSIISDENGFVYLAHDEGVEIYSSEDQKIVSIGAQYGLKNITPRLNSVSNDGHGKIYLGTGNGIVSLSKRLVSHQEQPIPLITTLKIFDDLLNVSDGRNYNFNYDENNFKINYTGFWYIDPENLNYRYIIQGYDIDWIDTKNRSATYSSIPPGSYEFRVQVSNTGNFENALEANFKFEITPPFWKTIWFYILSTIVVIAMGISYSRYRVKKLKEEKEILEGKVKERTREIAEQNEELISQKEQIEKQNKEITIKNDNITSSINYAKRIQNAILPQSDLLNTYFKNHSIYYRPRDIVSGDFYWIHEGKDRVYFAAVDCTGHGVPGAFMSLIGYSLLNEIVSNNPEIGPAKLLDSLHEGIDKSLKQSEGNEKSQSKDGMDVAICSYHKPSEQLIFTGAKRPLLLVRGEELIEYKGDPISIGGRSSKTMDRRFTDQKVDIKRGDKVFIFSDGYPDQFGGQDNRKYMVKNFKNLIMDHAQKGCPEIANTFDKEFFDWKTSHPQTDDILIITVEF